MRHHDRRIPNGARLLQAEVLERRQMLAGVTLITHGFGGSTEGWVSTMADAIEARTEHPSQPRYTIEVTDPGEIGGPLKVAQKSRSGSPVTELANPELTILLDWSDVAGSFFSSRLRNTFDVAAAVAKALTDPNLLEDLQTPIAQLPLHLIGHSRGGSLVGEIAHQLGEAGVWVDHVTTLDPHPVDGVRDPFGQDYGDAPMASWENVIFWDNYWRTDGDASLDFTGEPISGTHDVQLDEAVLGNFNGYLNEHSDVHLWYHGTIDTEGVIDDGEESASVDAGWYSGSMGPRGEIGYHFSRTEDGVRPNAGLTDAVGGSGNRSAIEDHVGDVWPSLVQLKITSPASLRTGDMLTASFYWHDLQGDASVSLYLDSDRNPYNGLGQQLGDPLPLELATETLENRTHSGRTAQMEAGDYQLVAAISDSEHIRYEYANESVSLAIQQSISVDNSSVRGNVLGATLGLVTVSGAGDEFSLSIDDSRFELVGTLLRLRDHASLPGSEDGSIVVTITAETPGTPSSSFQQSLAIAVLANPFAWQNSSSHLDSSQDGHVSPIDALVIINEIEGRTVVEDSSGRLPESRSEAAKFFYDTNGDGFATPIDVLLVVNYLNSESLPEAEAMLLTAANDQSENTHSITAASPRKPIIASSSRLLLGRSLLAGRRLESPTIERSSPNVEELFARIEKWGTSLGV